MLHALTTRDSGSLDRKRASAAPAHRVPLFDGRIQRKAQCACGGSCPRCKQQHSVSQPGDRDEMEADRIAARVMRMASPSANSSAPAAPVAAGPAGQPLPDSVRGFFEPRFGHSFASVRVHADHAAAQSAQSFNAVAYTSGENIVFNRGQYHPESASGKQLLAHELAHVVQQRGSPSPKIQRQTIATTCSAHQRDIQDAWDRAVEIVRDTLQTLQTMTTAMTLDGGPRSMMPTAANCVLTAFGDVGGLEGGGGMTFLTEIVKRFEKIQGGFTSGRNLRCDPQTVGNNECDWRDAFVVIGNSKDIFLCDALFARDRTTNSRAATLIHEMAHSVLRIGHDGIADRTYPGTFFDYSQPLGLDFDVAKKNAFAFEILASCLHGDRATSEVKAGDKKPAATATASAPPDRRFSFSASGGISIDPKPNPAAVQGLAGIAGRYNIRPGALVIFNPYIGLNALYAPTTSLQPKGFFTGAAEVGLRIQKPLSGPYVDVSAGGYLGFEAPLGNPVDLTGGFTGALGLGWKWDRIEVGPEVRTLIPGGDDPKRVVVLNKLTARF